MNLLQGRKDCERNQLQKSLNAETPVIRKHRMAKTQFEAQEISFNESKGDILWL
jgi:hypothetical protein